MSTAISSLSALPIAYTVAGKANVVVSTRRTGERGWLIDFEDDDATLVVVGHDGTALLGAGVPADELVAHFDAGHRTTRDGLGVAEGCTLCPRPSAGSFTRPGYVPPATDEPTAVLEEAIA